MFKTAIPALARATTPGMPRPLNLWWIPLWGAMGAAATTSVSYSAAVMLLARRYVLTTGVPMSELVLFTREDRRELVRAASRLERTGPTAKTSEQLRP